MPEREVATLLGHTYAVRRVLFSPHVETLVASCRCVEGAVLAACGDAGGFVQVGWLRASWVG